MGHASATLVQSSSGRSTDRVQVASEEAWEARNIWVPKMWPRPLSCWLGPTVRIPSNPRGTSASKTLAVGLSAWVGLLIATRFPLWHHKNLEKIKPASPASQNSSVGFVALCDITKTWLPTLCVLADWPVPFLGSSQTDERCALIRLLQGRWCLLSFFFSIICIHWTLAHEQMTDTHGQFPSL